MKRRGILKPTLKFLDIPVEQRNRIVDTFLDVKSQLRRGYTLKELGLKDSWDNITPKEFVNHPEEHYVKIIRNSHKKNIIKTRLIRSISTLYEVTKAGHKASQPESLDEWLLTLPST